MRRFFPIDFLTRFLPLLVSVEVLTVLLPVPPSFSQTEVRFQRFMLESGISDLTINAITQDSTGYLWVATRNGLNRYDGNRFKVFRSIPGDSTSLTHDNVQEVFVDSRGTLWVGTLLGLCRYDPSQHNFRRFNIDPSMNGGSEDVNKILEDSTGALWLAVAGMGVVKMDPQDGTFTRYAHDPGNLHTISNNSIRSLVIDKEGQVWAGSLGWGLNRINPLTGDVERFIHNPADPASVGRGRIETLGLDAEGNVWVGTQYDGLNMFRRGTKTFQRFTRDTRLRGTISANWVSGLLTDRSGTMWIGTQGGGVNTFSPRQRRFQSLTHDHFDRFSLSDDYCQTIFQDRTGEIWVGTGSGLNKVLRHSSAFRHLTNTPGREKLLASTSVSKAVKDRSGILWVGTEGGLTRSLDGSTKTLHYLANLTWDGDEEVTGVGTLIEDHLGTLWVGTGVGLFQVTRKHPFDEQLKFKQFKHDPHNSRSLSDDNVWSVHEDRFGVLWVGTSGGGLNRFDKATETWQRYRHEPGDTSTISNNNVTCCYEDHNGVLWVGTMHGLNMFHERDETFTRFLPAASNPNSLPSGPVFGIVEDRQGKLWIATARGLSVLDQGRKQFRNYYTDAGLPDVFLKGIVADMNGIMWISSRSGLTQAQEDSSGKISFTNYGEPEGLPVLDFNPLSFGRANDGEIMFGSGDGLIRFFPDQLRVKKDPPEIAITAFKVFDKERPMLPDMELTHEEYHVAIEFSAFDFAAPERQKFQYMMEGLDKNWLQAGHTRSALYANLSPGSYTFKVRGTNGDEVWHGTDAVYSFTILPPFWQTWWFRMLVIATMALAVYALYRYRLNRLLEVERLRLRLANDLHDELASNLSSIAMFGKIVHDDSAGGKGDHHQQTILLNRIIALAQESVHSIRDIIWALDPKPETLHDLLLRIHDSTTTVCNAKNIKLRFAMPEKENLPGTDLSPEVRKNFSLLMKEIINNAVKHSGCTELTVEPRLAGKSLEVRIQDNGTGFNVAVSHPGKGLKTMRVRADELGKDFAIHSEVGNGTLVRFTMLVK